MNYLCVYIYKSDLFIKKLLIIVRLQELTFVFAHVLYLRAFSGMHPYWHPKFIF